MRAGKLTGKELKDNVLSVISHRREEILNSARLGGDCARIALGADMLVHADPVTGEAVNIGSLAVEVSANDVIAAGGEPVAFLLTLILPESCDACDVKRIMTDAEREAVAWNAEIVGGHTEFSSAVTRPVVNAVAIGKAVDGWLPHTPEAGDAVVVTKTLGIEGTVILADMYPEASAGIGNFHAVLFYQNGKLAVCRLVYSDFFNIDSVPYPDCLEFRIVHAGKIFQMLKPRYVDAGEAVPVTYQRLQILKRLYA